MSFCQWVNSLAGEIEEERSDLERHLLVFGHRTDCLGLEHPQLIVPWFDLDATAERQRSNDVAPWFCCDRVRGGIRRSDRPGDTVAQVRTDQVGDFLRTVLQCLEEELCVSGLILVRRPPQQVHSLLGCRLFLVRCESKPKVAQRLLLVESQAIKERKLRAHTMSKHDVTEFVR